MLCTFCYGGRQMRHVLDRLQELLAVEDLVGNPAEDSLQLHGPRVQQLQRLLRSLDQEFWNKVETTKESRKNEVAN